MRATYSLRVAGISVAILMLSGANALVSAQSLADLAKKEEERRKSLPQPAKVYTNKDLGAVPAGSPAPPPAAGDSKETRDSKDVKDTTPSKDAPAADAKDKGEKKDQAYWSGKLRTLQEQLDRDRSYADAIQTKINALTTDFVNRDDPAQKRLIEADRLKALAELARLKKAVIDDTKAIADFQEDARRTGVPPGWLR
jgi:hypothetical protein